MCFDELTGQFALLTTFRKDGTPVPTTVWFARLGDEVVVGTGHATGKVKRIGNNPDVTLERSNFRGKRKGGPVCTGAARRVGGDEASAAEAALRKKYGFQWRFFGGNIDTYLAIAPTEG